MYERLGKSRPAHEDLPPANTSSGFDPVTQGYYSVSS